jgi:hypothetical protein
MKLLIPILTLACAFAGCSAPESTSATASLSSESSTDQKKCAACATTMAASDAVEKDGKTYCKGCIEAH